MSNGNYKEQFRSDGILSRMGSKISGMAMTKISVCSIVKNESKNIGKMLESAAKLGLEIIVVDTGSGDDTKEIALKFTDKVYDFEWCDDFSAAKNYAASRASNDWILFLDADEWIEGFNKDDVDYFIKKYPNAVGSVWMDNLTGTPENPGPISRIHIERLYDRRKFQYVSPIHEMIAPKYGKDMENYIVGITLGHSGYQMDDETRKRKSERNLSMLMKEYANDPDNPYLCYQIGKAYQMIYDHRNAYEYFSKGMSYGPDEELNYVSAMKACMREEFAAFSRGRVSVIIPCYNVEKWVGRCLESVVNQDFGLDKLEIICVDDYSTDSTLDVLKEWESKYPENIMIIPLEDNGRQGRARNIGLDYSTGEWIAFIDADDWVESDYLTKMYQFGILDNYDMVVSKLVRDSYDGAIMHEFSPEQKRINISYNEEGMPNNRSMSIDSDNKRELFICLQPVSYSACYRLIKRTFLVDNELYFPEGCAYEDTAWGSLVNLKINKVFLLEENLYHYFINDNSTVLAKDEEYHMDMLDVQEYKWNEWVNSGAWPKYSEALIYEHITYCFMGFMKVLALRFTNPPYELFITLKDSINSKFKDCRNNKYIVELLPEFHRAILDMLYTPISEDDFAAIIGAIRKHGGL